LICLFLILIYYLKKVVYLLFGLGNVLLPVFCEFLNLVLGLIMRFQEYLVLLLGRTSFGLQLL